MTVAELIATLSLKSDKNSFAAGEKLVGTIKKGIAALVAFKTVDIFKDMVQGTIDAASHLVDLAPQLGMSVEAVQQLGYAASQAGLEMDGLSTGMKILSKNAYAATHGSKEQKKVFKELGVTLKDAKGNLRGTDEILGDLAERFSKMPDGPEKTAMSMKVFGKSGATMIPFLNQGKAGINALKKEFVELGGQIDNGTAASMEELGDKQAKLGVAWQGMKNQIATALLPHLHKVADSIITWVKANKEFIVQKIHEAVEKFVEVAKRVWEWVQKAVQVAKDLWPTIQDIAKAIGSMVDAVGGAENAMRLLIGAWVTFKGLQLAGFLGGLASKMMAFAAATKAVGPVVTDMGNGVVMSMTKAGGGIGKGAAALAGSAGLVVAAAAAGYAFGTLIDKVFDLSGKLSSFLVDVVGDDALGQQSEASRNSRKRAEGFKGKTDAQVRQFAENGVTSAERNAAYQELASRSSARDTRVGPSAPTRARSPASERAGAGAGTSVGPTTVAVTVNGGGDPKVAAVEMEKAANRVLDRRLRHATVGVK